MREMLSAFTNMVIVLSLWQPIAQSGLSSALWLLDIVMINVAIYSRKRAVGGWLFYYFYWICESTIVSLVDFIFGYPQLTMQSGWQAADFHAISMLTFFPRCLAFLALTVVSGMVLVERNWVWVSRLRVGLVLALLVVTSTYVLEWNSFETNLQFGALRVILLLGWTLYFYFSKRVHHVFRTNDWEKFRDQITIDS